MSAPCASLTRMGYPRGQSAPKMLPAHERAKTERDAYAPRRALLAEPGDRRVYRLAPRPPAGDLSERLAGMLDDEQSHAVRSATGRTLILAAAGTGKTRVITSIVAHLTETGTEPRNVLLVTFTRRAAREMTLRAQTLAGRDLSEMTAGTFHSVCQRILRRYGPLVGLPNRYTILDGEDQADLVRIARDAVTAGVRDRASLPRPEWMAQTLALAHESGRPLAAVIVDQNPRLADRVEEIVAVCTRYGALKRESGAVDYADLLTLTVRLLTDHADVCAKLAAQFRWVLVDELHDVNAPQAAIVEALGAAGSHVVAVADPDQSIYAWRGADPAVVQRFADVPGTTVVPLGRNYRSTPQIVALAQECLPEGNRWDKRMVAHRDAHGAEPVVAHCLSIADEAAFVTQRIADLITEGREPGEIGILYRAHHHSIDIQMALAQAGVEFELFSGARFVESAHVKDVLAFCRVRHNPRDTLAWHRILRLFPGVGERTASAAPVGRALACHHRIGGGCTVLCFGVAHQIRRAGHHPGGGLRALPQFEERLHTRGECLVGCDVDQFTSHRRAGASAACCCFVHQMSTPSARACPRCSVLMRLASAAASCSASAISVGVAHLSPRRSASIGSRPWLFRTANCPRLSASTTASGAIALSCALVSCGAGLAAASGS